MLNRLLRRIKALSLKDLLQLLAVVRISRTIVFTKLVLYTSDIIVIVEGLDGQLNRG